jgi:periplasmic protein TonB
VLVTRVGTAAQIDLDHTSGSPALDRAAIDTVKNWQFVPARRAEEPLESWVIVPLVFKLTSSS